MMEIYGTDEPFNDFVDMLLSDGGTVVSPFVAAAYNESDDVLRVVSQVHPAYVPLFLSQILGYFETATPFGEDRDAYQAARFAIAPALSRNYAMARKLHDNLPEPSSQEVH